MATKTVCQSPEITVRHQPGTLFTLTRNQIAFACNPKEIYRVPSTRNWLSLKSPQKSNQRLLVLIRRSLPVVFCPSCWLPRAALSLAKILRLILRNELTHPGPWLARPLADLGARQQISNLGVLLTTGRLARGESVS
jgi:hypothetical protein